MTSSKNGPFSLARSSVHLGLGATSIPQPPYTDLSWYAEYGARHGGDGAEGRLVSMHTFERPWDVWEMHPVGTEVVLVTQGVLTLLQQGAHEVTTVRLTAGEYAINPAGVWHTADADAPVTAVFITAGAGTEHRPRDAQR